MSSRQSPKESLPRVDDEFFAKYQVRTDLALEATELIAEREGPPEIPGVKVSKEEKENVTISRVAVTTDAGARAMGKVKGNYVTLEFGALREHNRQVQMQISQLMATELATFFKGLGEDEHVLVVGLGNWNATPDALGPRVIGKLMITRHLFQLSPPELRGGLRPVCGIAPGVLGITGIETGETIQGIVDKVKPALIICIDALASRSTERLCTTLQIADTGIHPGSGIGNRRLGITPQTMGVPVIAIGVPTVIHAVTLVSDGMELISAAATSNGQIRAEKATGTAGRGGAEQEERIRQVQGQRGRGPVPAGGTRLQATAPQTRLDPGAIRVGSGTAAGAVETGVLGETGDMEIDTDAAAQERLQRLGRRMAGRGGPGIDPGTKRQVIQKLLTPYMGSMVVTPKEVDVLIEDAAKLVAGGLNLALHPGMDPEQMAQYTY